MRSPSVSRRFSARSSSGALATFSNPVAERWRLASSVASVLRCSPTAAKCPEEASACRGWRPARCRRWRRSSYGGVGHELLELAHHLLHLARHAVGGVEQARHHAPVDVVAVVEVIRGVAGHDLGDGASEQASGLELDVGVLGGPLYSPSSSSRIATLSFSISNLCTRPMLIPRIYGVAPADAAGVVDHGGQDVAPPEEGGVGQQEEGDEDRD